MSEPVFLWLWRWSNDWRYFAHLNMEINVAFQSTSTLRPSRALSTKCTRLAITAL